MRKHLLLGLTVSLFCAAAFGTTIVPLNSGYNHPMFMPYTPPATDNYWITIASYPTLPVAPAFAIVKPAAWAVPLAGSTWVNARNTAASGTGVSSANPGYAIYRKCFCILPNFKNPSISFRMRADDSVQVWFNSQLNTLLAPSPGHWSPSTSLLSSLPSQPQWFHAGRNCIYVLVEDVGSVTGFDIADSRTKCNEHSPEKEGSGTLTKSSAKKGSSNALYPDHPRRTVYVGHSPKATASAFEREDRPAHGSSPLDHQP